jgi:hypothetical protein
MSFTIVFIGLLSNRKKLAGVLMRTVLSIERELFITHFETCSSHTKPRINLIIPRKKQ